MALTRYAILVGDVVDNITVCDDPTFAQEQGWINIADARPTPGIAWTTTDGGATWVAPPQAPQVMTGVASAETGTGAALAGLLQPNGQDTTYHFEYGLDTTYGSQTASADAGSGAASVGISATLSGLSASTEYHYRLVATNATGTNYGADQTFTTTA